MAAAVFLRHHRAGGTDRGGASILRRQGLRRRKKPPRRGGFFVFREGRWTCGCGGAKLPLCARAALRREGFLFVMEAWLARGGQHRGARHVLRFKAVRLASPRVVGVPGDKIIFAFRAIYTFRLVHARKAPTMEDQVSYGSYRILRELPSTVYM